MSGIKLIQCLLFFVPESGQDIAAATLAARIKFYALLPEVFKTEHPEFLKLFTENGIAVMSALNGSSLPFASGVELEIIEILLSVTFAAVLNTLSFIVEDSNPCRVRRILASNTTIAVNTYLNSYCKEVYPAVDDNNAIIMKRILSQGRNIYYKHPSGENLLHLAAKRGHETLAKIILERGIDVNLKCTDGSTPLHVAVNGGHCNVVDLLLLNGANVGSKTNVGSTPLHIAAEGGHQCIVESLLQNGVDIESKNGEGSTALSLAVKKSDLDMVKLLLSNGADPDCRDCYGRTPLLKREKVGLEIAEVLLSYGARLNVQLINGQFAATFLDLWEDRLLSLLLLESCFCDPEILTRTGPFSQFVQRTARTYDLAQLLSREFRIDSLVHDEPLFSYICHIVKIIPLNLYPLLPGVEQIGRDQIDFKVKCESEVAQMKERTVGNTSLTFFDILTQSVSQVARFLKNSSVAQTVSSADLHTAFPNYAGMLKWQFRKGNQRKSALEEGIITIDYVSGLFRKLPREVKENILEYLSVRDILILKHAYAYTDV